MTNLQYFTSESVTSGHPDKVCDQISDAILDEMLREDKSARVAVETLASAGLIHVAGEVTTETYVDIAEVVRGVIRNIGYDSADAGFDADACGIMLSIGSQAPEIGGTVSISKETREGSTDPLDAQGAGDQGLMFGYACSETPQLIPVSIWLAHRLAERLESVRKDGTIAYLRPDGKTQVTVAYDGDTPVAVDTVVISTQHAEFVDGTVLSQQRIADDVTEHVIRPVLALTQLDTSSVTLIINPSGSFIHGGPGSDAGLTGRKIIVDTYGGAARHGGGAFSGKDPSKVDRSAAYAMRWVAKNAVAAGLASRLEVQVAYAIGQARPVGVYVETFGTHTVDPDVIRAALVEVFDLRPLAIINDLDLLNRTYLQTSTYGHFGRDDANFTWENTDRVDALKAAVARLTGE